MFSQRLLSLLLVLLAPSFGSGFIANLPSSRASKPLPSTRRARGGRVGDGGGSGRLPAQRQYPAMVLPAGKRKRSVLRDWETRIDALQDEMLEGLAIAAPGAEVSMSFSALYFRLFCELCLRPRGGTRGKRFGTKGSG